MEDVHPSHESDNEKYYDYIYDSLEEDIYGRTAEQAPNDSSLKTEGPKQVAVLTDNNEHSRIQILPTEDNVLKESLAEMEKENGILRRRFSELLKTARLEIGRKNDQIIELTKKLDDLLLKRNRPLEEKGKCLKFDKRKQNTDSSTNYKKHQKEQKDSFEKYNPVEHIMEQNSEIINNFVYESEDCNFSRNVTSFTQSSNQLKLKENKENSTLIITQKSEINETDGSLVNHPNLFSARMHNKRRTNHDRNSTKIATNSGLVDVKIIQENIQPDLTNPKTIPDNINQNVLFNDKQSNKIYIEPQHSKLKEENLLSKDCSVIKIADTNLKDPRILKDDDVEPKAIDLRINIISKVPQTDIKVENDPNKTFVHLARPRSKSITEENQKNNQIESVISKGRRKSVCDMDTNLTLDCTEEADQNLDQQHICLRSNRIPKISSSKNRDTRDILSDLHDDVQATLRDTMQIEMGQKCNDILKDCEAKLRNQSISKDKIRPDKVPSNSRDKSKTRLGRGKSMDREKEHKDHSKNYSSSRYDSRERSRERGRNRSRSSHYKGYRQERCRSRDKDQKSGRSKDRRDKSSHRYTSRDRSRSRNHQRNRTSSKERSSKGIDRKIENLTSEKERSRSNSNESKERKTKNLVKISIDEYKSKLNNFKEKVQDCKLNCLPKSDKDFIDKNKINKLKEKPFRSSSTNSQNIDNLNKQVKNDNMSRKNIETVRQKFESGKPSKNIENNVHKQERTKSNKTSTTNKKIENNKHKQEKTKSNKVNSTSYHVEELLERLHEENEILLTHEDENSIDKVLELYNRDLEIYSGDSNDVDVKTSGSLEHKDTNDLLKMKRQLLAELTSENSLEEGEILDDEQIKVNTQNDTGEITSKTKNEQDKKKILKDDKSFKKTKKDDKRFETDNLTNEVKTEEGEKGYIKGEKRTTKNEIFNEGQDTNKHIENQEILSDPMEINQIKVTNIVLASKEKERNVSDSEDMKKMLNEENVPLDEKNITRVSNIFEENSRMEMKVSESRINIISHIKVVGASNHTFSHDVQNLSSQEKSLLASSKTSIQIDSVGEKAEELTDKQLLYEENRSCTSACEIYDSSCYNPDASSNTLNESNSDKPRKRITPILVGPPTSKAVSVKNCDYQGKIRSPKKSLVRSSKKVTESSNEKCTENVKNYNINLKTTPDKNFAKESKDFKSKTEDKDNLEKNLDKTKNQMELPCESNRLENSDDTGISKKSSKSESTPKKSDHPELTLRFVRSRGDSNNYEISTDDERGLSERVANSEPILELQNDIKEGSSVDALDDIPKEVIRYEELKDTGVISCTQNAQNSSCKGNNLINTPAKYPGVSKGKVMENLKREILGNKEVLNESSFSVDDSSTSKSPKIFKQTGGKIMDLLKKEALINLNVTMAENTESGTESFTQKSIPLEKIETVNQKSTETKIVDNQLINILKNDEHARKLPNKQKSKGKYMIRIQQHGDSNSKDSNSSSDMDTEEIDDRSIKIEEKRIHIFPKKRLSIGKRIDNQLMELLKKQAEAVKISDDSTNSEESLLKRNEISKISEETLKTLDVRDFQTFKNITPESKYPENHINISMPNLDSNSSPYKKSSASKSNSIEAKMINIFGEDITLDQSDFKLDKKDIYVESQTLKNQSCIVPLQEGNLCSQTPLWKQMEISDDSTDESDLFQPMKNFPEEVKNAISHVNSEIFTDKNQVCEQFSAENESKKVLHLNEGILHRNFTTSSVLKTGEIIQKIENLNPQKISQILSQEIKLKNPLIIEKNKTSPRKTKSTKRKAKNSPVESSPKRSKKNNSEKISPKRTKSLFPAIRLNPVRRSPRKSKKVVNKQPLCESDESFSDSSDEPLKVAKKPRNSSKANGRKTPVNKKKCETPKATPKRKKSTPTTSIEPNKIPTPDLMKSPDNFDMTPIIRRRNSKSSSPGPRLQNANNVSKSSVDSTPISLNKVNKSRRSSSGKNAKGVEKHVNGLEQTFEEELLKVDNALKVNNDEKEKNQAASSPLMHFENMLIGQQTNDKQKVIQSNKKGVDSYPVIHIEDLTFADNCDFQNKSLLNFVEAINVTSSNFNLLKDSNSGVEPTRIVSQEQPNLLTFTSYLNSSKLSTSTPLKINKIQRCISFEQTLPTVVTNNDKENAKVNSVSLDKQKNINIINNHQNSPIEEHNTSVSSQNSSLNRSDLDSSAERKRKVVNYTFGVGIKRSKTRRPVVELVD